MRKPLIAGNAKMNLDRTALDGLLGELKADLARVAPACQVVYCPPFTLLSAALDWTRDTEIALGAQDMHWENEGAYTGEISGSMLVDVGCRYVILGHSERRALFGETDGSVARKTAAAVAAGLVPIVCVGETERERDEGRTKEVLSRQISGSLIGVSVPAAGIVIAYEPVWAIGTGRNATPDQAQEAHVHLRQELGRMWGREVAHGVRILYGGSVKPANAASLLERSDIDGALVGGASLAAESFLGIIRSCP
jgi:triosephosphate isomerase